VSKINAPNWRGKTQPKRELAKLKARAAKRKAKP